MINLIRTFISRTPRFFAVFLPLVSLLMVFALKFFGYELKEQTSLIVICISLYLIIFGVSTPWVETKEWRNTQKFYQKFSSLEDSNTVKVALIASMIWMPLALFFEFNLLLKLFLLVFTLIIFTVYWFVPFAILFMNKNSSVTK